MNTVEMVCDLAARRHNHALGVRAVPVTSGHKRKHMLSTADMVMNSISQCGATSGWDWARTFFRMVGEVYPKSSIRDLLARGYRLRYTSGSKWTAEELEIMESALQEIGGSDEDCYVALGQYTNVANRNQGSPGYWFKVVPGPRCAFA